MIIDPSSLLEKHLFDYDPKNCQPNSYDLRTGAIFEICGGVTLYADGGKDLPQYKRVPTSQNFFTLFPGVLYQVEALERVEMPEDLCGISIMRSSMAKSGASGEIGLYDSGYKGSLGMTVRVQHLCRIEYAASVAQILFMTADTSCLYEGEYLDSQWTQRLIDKKK